MENSRLNLEMKMSKEKQKEDMAQKRQTVVTKGITRTIKTAEYCVCFIGVTSSGEIEYVLTNASLKDLDSEICEGLTFTYRIFCLFCFF